MKNTQILGKPVSQNDTHLCWFTFNTNALTLKYRLK